MINTSIPKCLPFALATFLVASCGMPPEGLEEVELDTLDSALTGTVKVTSYVDLNKDGRPDRVQRTALANCNATTPACTQFWVSLALATSPVTYATAVMWQQHGEAFKDTAQGQFADVTGDGRPDLIYRSASNQFWVSRTNSTGTGFIQPPGMWVQHGGTYHVDSPKYADVTGDGKADLIYRGLDNIFWVSVTNSTGTAFATPVNWYDHTTTFASGQATYSDLNADGRADLTFKTSATATVIYVSLSTGTKFDTAIARDPACPMSAYGCLVVTSAALPGVRNINVDWLEPTEYPYTPKSIGTIRPGERLLVHGTVRSVLSFTGSQAGSDYSDYVTFGAYPGVTVSGSINALNTPTYQHLCSSGYSNYNAGIQSNFSTYIYAYFSNSLCQALSSDLTAPYGVNLTGSRGTIYIQVVGPSGTFKVTSTRGVFPLAAGTYTVRASTDGDLDGILCEAGDFCHATTAVIDSRNLKSVALTPR